MVKIVDGKQIAESILDDLKARVQNLKNKGVEPALAVVLVGDNKPSQTYVKKKGEAAEKIGLTFFKFEFPASISKDDLISEIKRFKQRKIFPD